MLELFIFILAARRWMGRDHEDRAIDVGWALEIESPNIVMGD